MHSSPTDRSCSYVALNFTAYEFFRNLLAPPPTSTSPTPTPSVLNRLACGALAGSVAQTATYPLELLRRRLQVTGMPGSKYKYKGMWDAWTTIVRQEGVKGLYAGTWFSSMLYRMVPVGLTATNCKYRNGPKLLKSGACDRCEFCYIRVYEEVSR